MENIFCRRFRQQYRNKSTKSAEKRLLQVDQDLLKSQYKNYPKKQQRQCMKFYKKVECSTYQYIVNLVNWIKNVQPILLYGCEVCFDRWHNEFNIVSIWILMLFKAIIHGKLFLHVNVNSCSLVGSSVVIVRQDRTSPTKSSSPLEPLSTLR